MRAPRRIGFALKSLGVVVIGLAGAGIVALALAYPALAAVGCPSCYGFEAVGDRVYVGRDMPEARRVRLLRDLAKAERTVAATLQPVEARPHLFACSTLACDRRLGGRGRASARAEVFTTPFFTSARFGPLGINETILTHELAHVVLHEAAGFDTVMDGRFPAWLNEGVAVLVSRDMRYLRTGDDAQDRCLKAPRASLPSNPFEWAPAAGRDHGLYAEAACAAMGWLAENGGYEGLLNRLKERRLAETLDTVEATRTDGLD